MDRDISKLKRRKTIKVIYLTIIHVGLVASIIVAFGLQQLKNELTQEQVQKIAVSYALKDCLKNSDANVQCSYVIIDKPIYHDSEYSYWEINYHTSQGPTRNGWFYLSRFGNLEN
ncbi:MAG TPA: hypothetical protein VMR45_05660 [Patescibacteria group bacterium]|jgi:hypothetical protein|nr:hypothetical protein [Patescibacteria group bacterium]